MLSAFLGGKIMTKASPPWNTTAASNNNPLNNTWTFRSTSNMMELDVTGGFLIWYNPFTIDGAPTTARKLVPRKRWSVAPTHLRRLKPMRTPMVLASFLRAIKSPKRLAAFLVTDLGSWKAVGFHGIPRLGR